MANLRNMLTMAVVLAVPGLAFSEAPATRPAAAATQPATRPSATQPAGSPDAILQNLLRREQANPVLPPTAGPLVGTPILTPAAPNTPVIPLLPEDTIISDRVGRLEKDSRTGQWVFVFEADGKPMQDPPMFLLPSRLLSTMRGASKDGQLSVKFRVSGIVTEYMGHNYLLPRVVQQVRDMNQF